MTRLTASQRRRLVPLHLSVVLSASMLASCGASVEAAPVSAPAVLEATPRHSAPVDFTVQPQGDRLVARWAAPSTPQAGDVLEYEMFINTAPAIPLAADLDVFELPGVTVKSGAFVQIRAVGEGGPGDAAIVTVKPVFPPPAPRLVAAAPPQIPSPTAAPVPAPVIAPRETKTPEVEVPPPAPAMTPPSSQVLPQPVAATPPPAAPPPAAVPPPQVDRSVTIKSVLNARFSWPDDIVEEAYCETTNLTIKAYNGANAIDAVAAIEETTPVDVERDGGSIRWGCSHAFSITVTGDSPGYNFVAENQALKKVEPWELFVATDALTTTSIRPYLSYCAICS